MMNFEPIILDGFEGREQALAEIKRYVHGITPIMMYRTNDLIHARRVTWHLEQLIPDILQIFPNFRVDYARTLALVHDDAEIITGDVQLCDKERMTSQELQALANKEELAIPQLVKRFGNDANGFIYETLLRDAKQKQTLEAKFASFCDKLDGGGEAWHEVFAGNHYFLLPAGGHNGSSGGYVKRVNAFQTKYPIMTLFFENFPEYLPIPLDFREVVTQGKPHTPNSLSQDSGYIPYERWKQAIIPYEGTELLTTQRELGYLPTQ